MKHLLLLLTAVWLSSCVSQPPVPAERHLTLVYSGNLDGELEPCGCSEGGNKGGIKRRANAIDQLRQQNPELLLISAGGLITSEMPQDKLKAEYILKGLAMQDYDAVGIQWQDLAYGDAFLKQSGLSFVASNHSGFAPSIRVQRAGVSLQFFQWLDPDSNPEQAMTAQTTDSRAAMQKLRQQLAAAKQQGDTTVLSTTLTAEQAKADVPLQYVDILIIKAKYEVFGEAKKMGDTLVLQPGSRGMRLGKVELSVQADGSVKAFQQQIIPLPPEVGDAPRMAAWYQEYNNKVTEAYQQRVAQRKVMMKETPYATEKVCANCHKSEHDTWFDTAHAEAYYQLMDVNKGYDPDCIGCHVLGFEKPGGFIDPMLTSNLMHVQCENCHGAAKAHADSAGQTKTGNSNWQPQQMCQQCHVQKHSPDFDFDTYWPRIAHGK